MENDMTQLAALDFELPSRNVRPLRTRILRPTWTDRLATYPEDDAPDTFHAAGFTPGSDEVHGTATIYPEAPPAERRGGIPEAAYAEGAAFRLRGMATSDEARGTGIGRDLLMACFAHVREADGRYLWCNARIGAVGFYERMGLQTVGPEFPIEGIGPHFVMWRAL